MSRMIFQDLGGIDQLLLTTPEELATIHQLDKARWAATSVPCSQLMCDPAFLTYADTDTNGRIRVEELCAAQSWLWARLKDRSRLADKTESLRIADLDAEHTEARQLKALAQRLLQQLGAANAGEITLAQVRDFRSTYTSRYPNGDGVVAPAHATDAAITSLIEQVVAATGGAAELSGVKGADTASLAAWETAARAFLVWKAKGEGEGAAAIHAFGPDTAGAVALVQELAPKVAQFFAQCALVTLETNANARLQATPEELAALDVRDPAAIDAWLTRAPMAPPASDAVLRLTGPANPKYAAAMQRLATDVAPRALGRTDVTTLTAAEWATILGYIQPWLAWRAERPANIPEDTDAAALLATLDGPLPGQIRSLIEADLKVADELLEFNNLEKVILYQRWLLQVANNMVSFPDLFAKEERALFEMGTLILDGRRFTFTVKVADKGAHRKLAEATLMFIAYVELNRKDAAGNVHTASVASAVTAGTKGGIAVGKRGVFYDRDGVEWDAVVSDVITNPISIWEAMMSPIDRLRALIAERVEKFAGSKATALEGSATGVAAGTAPVPGAAAEKKEESSSSNMQNLLVGGSVAFAAIGSSLAFIVQTVSDIDIVSLVGGLGGLVLGLMAVSGFLGWLRLRRRDISALLEACEWALNGRMRLTSEQALIFTSRPPIPAGSERRAAPGAWRIYLAAFLLIAGALGLGYYFYSHPEALDALRAPAEAPPAEAAPAEAAPAPAP